jgi:hypothetical protein
VGGGQEPDGEHGAEPDADAQNAPHHLASDENRPARAARIVDRVGKIDGGAR